MDKEFWVSLAKNDYKIPQEHTLENLTEMLFSYLSSTDPELRDDIAYIVYANWLKRELFSAQAVKSHVDELLSNLDKGIGETESDTVFLRAFSILLLAEIVHNDNKKPVLDKDQVKKILEKGIWYMGAEKDPRGHIPAKGWAHALAHTADLMLVLARNRYIDGGDLWSMLATIAYKMVHSINYVYIHGEDERLASAVIEILRRDLVSPNQLEAWADSLAHPDGTDWKGALAEEDRNHAFQNTRNLLRSIYFALLKEPEEFPDREQHIRLVLKTLSDLKPY
ncbi:MAG TPA: DUF2785 domain-containing protein [Anaerolineales bacterium]|nr:DUF2785 domain-containing protein [Anaerolineales bacterium]